MHDNVLTVSGKTSAEREEKSESGQYLVSERRWGSFSRSVAVPNGLKPEEIQASMVSDRLMRFISEARLS